MTRWLRRLFVRLIVLLACLVGLYYMLAAPPLHLYFKALPPAGPSTVYVPGSGFSGFWYHLGALQSVPNLHDFDYYCYSSGCLSTVLALLNTSVDQVATVAFEIQEAWENGTIHRYEMTEQFVHRLIVQPLTPQGRNATTITSDETPLPTTNNTNELVKSAQQYNKAPSPSLQHSGERVIPNLDRHQHHSAWTNKLWDRLHILVTSVEDGVVVRKPRNLAELKEQLIQSAWIPFVTGWGVPEDGKSGKRHLDGGFSRVLHPPCEYHLGVPLTWELAWHTLNPGLNRRLVWKFWEYGRRGNHPHELMRRRQLEVESANHSTIEPGRHDMNPLGDVSVQQGER